MNIEQEINDNFVASASDRTETLSINDAIAEIYQAALEPQQLHAIMQDWEARLELLSEPHLQEHLLRGAKLLHAQRPDREHPLLHALNPSFSFSADGVITHANPAARQRYNITPADAVSETGLPTDVLAAIERVVTSNQVVIPTRAELVVTQTEPNVSYVIQQASQDNTLYVLQSDELVWPAEFPALLQYVLKLTPAEAAVFISLAQGLQVPEIAQQRNSRVATVRAQVRSIHAKARIRNQQELTRLAINLGSMLSSSHHHSLSTDRAAFDDHFLKLQDGRKLSYRQWGAESGFPVLFLHDEYYGWGFPPEFIRELTTLNIRLLAPARPYFGDSDGYRADADPTTQTALDLVELLDHLGLDQVGILSRRTGFRYVVELAHKQPERVVFAINLSPALPADSEQHYQGLDTYPRLISRAIFGNRALVVFLANLGFRYLQTHGYRKFAEFLNRSSPLDLEVLHNPAHWLQLIEGFEFGTQHGPQAYLHDVRHDPKLAWQRCVSCCAPMLCLIGEHDPNDRLRRAQALQAAGAPLEISVIADGGQLLHLSHWPQVLAALSDSMATLTADTATG